ncbi:MAG: hypothetical protein PPP58_08610 [Natronomonas sp.]
MHPTTEGEFRVLAGRTPEEWLFVDVDSVEPTYVPAAAVDGDIEVGNRIRATIEWDDGTPTRADATVVSKTTFTFVRTTEPVFEAAQACFETARSEGEGMNSRVTYDTDSNPNGVVYTFADQPGSRDLFSEFRDGEKPLEPLVDRAAEGGDRPFSVYIIDPEEPFVVVYIVLKPGGRLDSTVRETYC